MSFKYFDSLALPADPTREPRYSSCISVIDPDPNLQLFVGVATGASTAGRALSEQQHPAADSAPDAEFDAVLQPEPTESAAETARHRHSRSRWCPPPELPGAGIAQVVAAGGPRSMAWLPVPALLRELDVSFRPDLSGAGCLLLCAALRARPCPVPALARLRVAHSLLGPEDAAALASALPCLPALTRLDVSGSLRGAACV
jgi:hypothetical protein